MRLPPGVATVCQHIWALEHLDLFQRASIPDLFWSQATQGLPHIGGVRLHPFPLYPVPCPTHPPAEPLSPPTHRPLLSSFQGDATPSRPSTANRCRGSQLIQLVSSGSGPNFIRLWEALGYGSIPVILSD